MSGPGCADGPVRSCRAARSSPPGSPLSFGRTWLPPLAECWARIGCSSGPGSIRPRRPPSGGRTWCPSRTWRVPTGPWSASSSRARGDRGLATAHYGRFLEVLGEYQEMREADPPSHRPTRSWAPDEGGRGHRTGDVLHRPRHRRMLGPLQRRLRAAPADDRALLRLGHETPEQRQVCLHVRRLMFGVIKPLGLLLASLPVGADIPPPRPGHFQLPTGRASCSRTAARPGSGSPSASTSWAPSLRPPSGHGR